MDIKLVFPEPDVLVRVADGVRAGQREFQILDDVVIQTGRERQAVRLDALVGIALFLGFFLQTMGTKFITASKVAFFTGSYVILLPFFTWIMYKKRHTYKTIKKRRLRNKNLF